MSHILYLYQCFVQPLVIYLTILIPVVSSFVAIMSSHSLFQWAVLTCGHCFCNECIAIIVEQYSVGSRRRAIKCAICRQTTSHTEISYVFTTQSSSQDQDIPVKVSQKHRPRSGSIFITSVMAESGCSDFLVWFHLD